MAEGNDYEAVLTTEDNHDQDTGMLVGANRGYDPRTKQTKTGAGTLRIPKPWRKWGQCETFFSNMD